LQDVNNTGPETLPVSVYNCFLYFTCKENILKMSVQHSDSILYVLLVVFYPSFYVVLKKLKQGSASGPVLFTSCKMV